MTWSFWECWSHQRRHHNCYAWHRPARAPWHTVVPLQPTAVNDDGDGHHGCRIPRLPPRRRRRRRRTGRREVATFVQWARQCVGLECRSAVVLDFRGPLGSLPPSRLPWPHSNLFAMEPRAGDPPDRSRWVFRTRNDPTRTFCRVLGIRKRNER